MLNIWNNKRKCIVYLFCMFSFIRHLIAHFVLELEPGLAWLRNMKYMEPRFCHVRKRNHALLHVTVMTLKVIVMT